METHKYFEYNDLKSSDYIREYPKSNPEISKGFPCEYYKAVIQVKNAPRGYTNYHFAYDINNEGVIVRVGVRIHQYEQSGQTKSEPYEHFDGKFSPALRKKIYQDYVNPDILWGDFKTRYPWSKNPSSEAYDIIYSGLHHDYPSGIKFMKITQMHYKGIKLTFCFFYNVKTGKIKLFDILLGENYDDLTKRLHFEKGAFVFTNACVSLVKSIYKNAPKLLKIRIVLDPYLYPILYDTAAKHEKCTKRSKDILRKRKDDLLEHICDMYSAYNAQYNNTECLNEVAERLSFMMEKESVELKRTIDALNYCPDILKQTSKDLDYLLEGPIGVLYTCYYSQELLFLAFAPLPMQIASVYSKKFGKKNYNVERFWICMLHYLQKQNFKWETNPYWAFDHPKHSGLTFAPNFMHPFSARSILGSEHTVILSIDDLANFLLEKLK